jgi:hypothetical protein
MVWSAMVTTGGVLGLRRHSGTVSTGARRPYYAKMTHSPLNGSEPSGQLSWAVIEAKILNRSTAGR